MQGAPDTWPVETMGFIMAFAGMLITKTPFPAGQIIAETARFMDAAANFPEEIVVNLHSGMTAEHWPAMLSSLIGFMHKEGRALALKPDQHDAEYLARLNAHILDELRKLNA